ncbi:MAG: hemerythrin domain-containing protein [Deltaproteobacteria bacterium]|nr:hemerythrin domain-containing protein [Deltaproteobacteria bacterium]
MDILYREHDALRAQLAAARRLCELFETAEPLTHEVQRAWPDARTTLQELHSCLSITLPLHHRNEELSLYPRLLAANLSRPERTLIKEIAAEHAGLELLTGVLLDVITPWLRVSIPPRHVELPRFVGLVSELSLHLERHIAIEDQCILPLAATMLTAAQLDEVAAEIKKRTEPGRKPSRKPAAK